MKILKPFSIALLATTLLVVPGLARSNDGPPPAGGPPGRGPSLERVLEHVELPSDVRARVDSLLDEAHGARRVLHRKLRAAHHAMRALLEAEKPSEKRIMSQADEIGRLRTALEKGRLRTLLEIRAVLSPDQRKAMTQALKSRIYAGREGRHGPCGEGPPR